MSIFEITESNSNLLLCGISHHQTNIGLRECFAFSNAALIDLLNLLKQSPWIQGCVAISTCNRFELIVDFKTLDLPREKAESVIGNIIANHAGLKLVDCENLFYFKSGKEVVSHLFLVSCGLDSVIIGEPQILGQIKRAYEVSLKMAYSSTSLNKLFHKTFQVAKLIRSVTGVGQNAISVGFAVKALVKEIFGELSDVTVMLIGAGEVGVLTLKHLKAAGVRKFFVVNKTLENAVKVANSIGGIACSLPNMKEFLPQADIIVGASSLSLEQEKLLTESDVKNSYVSNLGSVKCFVDLGVPRNFDSNIENIENAFLYTIDDLRKVVSDNLTKRREEFNKPKTIIDSEVSKFCHRSELDNLVPLLLKLNSKLAIFKDKTFAVKIKMLRKKPTDTEYFQRFKSQLFKLESELDSRFCDEASDVKLRAIS
jgi:glutamyl-tRNA reductase